MKKINWMLILILILILGTFRQAGFNSKLQTEIAQLKVEALEKEAACLKRYNTHTDCLALMTNIIKGFAKFHFGEDGYE